MRDADVFADEGVFGRGQSRERMLREVEQMGVMNYLSHQLYLAAYLSEYAGNVRWRNPSIGVVSTFARETAQAINRVKLVLEGGFVHGYPGLALTPNSPITEWAAVAERVAPFWSVATDGTDVVAGVRNVLERAQAALSDTVQDETPKRLIEAAADLLRVGAFAREPDSRPSAVRVLEQLAKEASTLPSPFGVGEMGGQNRASAVAKLAARVYAVLDEAEAAGWQSDGVPSMQGWHALQGALWQCSDDALRGAKAALRSALAAGDRVRVTVVPEDGESADRCVVKVTGGEAQPWVYLGQYGLSPDDVDLVMQSTTRDRAWRRADSLMDQLAAKARGLSTAVYGDNSLFWDPSGREGEGTWLCFSEWEALGEASPAPGSRLRGPG
jgi:hypothetical protein